MSETPPSTMRRDIVSAYLATASKILSWVVVSGLVYRQFGAGGFGLLALTRATLGILNYTSLGLAPALIHRLAKSGGPALTSGTESSVLEYESRRASGEFDEVYSNGLAAAVLTAIFGLVVTLIYAKLFHRLHFVPAGLSGEVFPFVVAIGLGTILRLASDAPGAVLQTRGRIALDNLILACGDLAWPLFLLVLSSSWWSLVYVGGLYVVANLLVLIARTLGVVRLTRSFVFRPSLLSTKLMAGLIGFGTMVCLAQLADYLYAPTDYILINWFFGSASVAIYAPAVQIDSALLLLVSAIATVLLPKAAIAHAADDRAQLRRLYIRGTFASAVIVALAGAGVWLLSTPVFRVWFDDPMVRTKALLPLVLIHTVVGGSAMVGRSILIGMGKVKPFTIAVLIAGISNVILSFIFVRFFDLGLRGIIYGTIIAVVGRCAVWMPWYVLRTLRRPITSSSAPNPTSG